MRFVVSGTDTDVGKTVFCAGLAAMLTGPKRYTIFAPTDDAFAQASKRMRDNLAPGLRVCPYQSYCVYYVHDDDTVTIVRVVHSARDVRAMF